MVTSLALVLAMQLPAADDQRPGTAIVRGHVVASDTGQALRKADVRILAPDIRENRLTTTDSQGRFEFREVKAGRYTVSAFKGGYVTMTYGQTGPLQGGTPLEIRDGQTIERLEFSLQRGGVITGRIVDEFGEPLPEVMVTPMRYQFTLGKRTLVPGGRVAQTDDNGEFRIFGMTPGDYFIQASRTSNPFGPGSGAQPAYVPMFFPGVVDAGQAQRFTIAAGQQLDDISMALQPTKAVTVSGTIVTSDGRPYSGMLNVLRTAGNGIITNNAAMIVQWDGTFQLKNLTPGDYYLRTFASATPGRDPEMAMAKITVATEDIADLQLVTSKALSVSGRVIVDAAAAQLLPTTIAVGTFSMDGAPPGPNMNSPGRLNDDLTFTLKTAPGLARILVQNLPKGWAVRKVRLNGVDVIDTGVEFKANENVKGLEVELTNRVTTITGLAMTGRGEPSKNYTVVVFPQGSERWNQTGIRYNLTGRPDQDGRFKISNLPPADYFIIAVDTLEPGDATNPEFFERIRSRATRFSLIEGETKSIDLTLSPSS